MNIKSTWNNANKGLLVILGTLLVATIGTLIYLANTLLGLQRLVNEGGTAVGKVFVLQDILINTQNAQTGVRGYVLTGDSEFLEPYNKALIQLPADIRIMNSDRQLALSEGDKQRIETLINEKLAITKRIIETRDRDGFEAAQALIASKEPEMLMSNLRNDINQISANSLRDIGPMQQRSRDDIKLALWVGMAMSTLVLGACAAVLWYFRRAILQERALESTKNEFLSLASHQLRTPATNVKQYLGLVMDGYMGELTEQQRKALAVAYKNNESEIKIMNDLLDVAKLDLKRIQLHKKVTNVMAIARTVIKDYKQRLQEKDQTIELKGAKVIMANVDKEYVKGAIQNLVDNATKYSHPGKKIVLRVEREQDEIRISVQDRGVGIKKRDYAKLFNKFSRLANEFSANSEGSGLGLYWVKQVVELHGGRIDIRSRDGQGTTFTIYLPVR